jgi:hypothetical protein
VRQWEESGSGRGEGGREVCLGDSGRVRQVNPLVSSRMSGLLPRSTYRASDVRRTLKSDETHTLEHIGQLLRSKNDVPAISLSHTSSRLELNTAANNRPTRSKEQVWRAAWRVDERVESGGATERNR